MNGLKQELIGEPRSKQCKDLLGQAVRDCLDENGRYVLVAFGHDFTPLQYTDVRQKLVDLFRTCGYENPAVEVIGQGQLRDFFSSYPSISLGLLDHSAFTFQTVEEWKANRDMTSSLQLAEAQKKFIENVRTSVRGGGFQHIHVIGEPGMGKTRLVLEAMSADDLAPATLYIPHAEDFLLSQLFEDLLQPEQQHFVHLVIDDCEEGDRDSIRHAIKVKPNIMLVTIDHAPLTVSDSSVKIIECPLLPDKQIEKVIRSYLTDRKDISNWIRWCGGSPRVAHTVGESLSRKPNDALKPPAAVPIWDRFMLGHKTRKTADAEQHLLVLRHIALFQRFGFEAPADDEAKFISALVRKADQSITWTRFQSIVRHFKERRILHGKKTLYLVPKALHVYLWLGYWEHYGREFTFQKFFSQMPSQLRKWFMEVFICAHAEPAAGQIIKEILNPTKGPFVDQAFLVSEAGTSFLNYLAVADPASTLALLEATLGVWPKDKLQCLCAGRQDITGMLQKIAVRKDLFSRAANMLVRMSLAGNDDASNAAKNSLHILSKIGLGWAPTEATPDQRFAVIEELLRGNDDAKRCLGLDLCTTWLGDCGGKCISRQKQHALKPTAEFWKQKTTFIAGKEIVVLMPTVEFWRPTTYGDLYDCYRKAWRFLWEETRGWQETARRRANSILIESASGMLLFSTLADQVVTTLFEIAKDPATDQAELTAQVLYVQQAKLSLSIISRVKALDRMMKHASLWERFSQDVQRPVDVLKDFISTAVMRRFLPLFHTGKGKIIVAYNHLKTRLREISLLNSVRKHVLRMITSLW